MKNIDINTGVSLGVIVHQETGEILLVRNIAHHKPMLKLPGGTIEKGEIREQALLREIKEETGIHLEQQKTKFLFSILAESGTHYYHVFACLADNFMSLHKKPVQDGNSVLEIMVIDVKKISTLVMVPRHRLMLETAIKEIRRVGP